MGDYRGYVDPVFKGEPELSSETNVKRLPAKEQVYRSVIDASLKKFGVMEFKDLEANEKQMVELNIAFLKALDSKEAKLGAAGDFNFGYKEIQKMSLEFVQKHHSETAIKELMDGVKGVNIYDLPDIIEKNPKFASYLLDKVSKQSTVMEMNKVLTDDIKQEIKNFKDGKMTVFDDVSNSWTTAPLVSGTSVNHTWE